MRYAVNVDSEGKYLKAVAALCNIRNRNNMLQDSKDVYFFSNEQLDVNGALSSLGIPHGTSTFCEPLIYLLGDYALTMKPESLAVKQNLDSRQANRDIARLAGCRFCNASEPPKRMLFDTALLKSLLGRDSITARHLHQREHEAIQIFRGGNKEVDKEHGCVSRFERKEKLSHAGLFQET